MTSVGRLKIAAALVLAGPFIPMLFQGEEWAASSPFLYFTDHEDAELGRLVTEGRRREFAAFSAHAEEVPDPQARETFERSKLVWDESGNGSHAEVLEWHRRLIRLRREIPALRAGDLERLKVSFDERAAWLVMTRADVAVACNLAQRSQRMPVSLGANPHILLASEKEVRIAESKLELPADSVAIVAQTRRG